MPRKHIKTRCSRISFLLAGCHCPFWHNHGFPFAFGLYISMQTVLIFFNIMKLGIIPSNKMLSFRACLKARNGQVLTYTIHGF